MLQKQTFVKVKDNSGVKHAQCIKIYKKPFGSIGETVLISVKSLNKKLNTKEKIQKGDLYKGLIINTKYKTRNTTIDCIKFDDNAIVLLNPNHQPKGTRVFGNIPLKLRFLKQLKVISLSSNLI